MSLIVTPLIYQAPEMFFRIGCFKLYMQTKYRTTQKIFVIPGANKAAETPKLPSWKITETSIPNLYRRIFCLSQNGYFCCNCVVKSGVLKFFTSCLYNHYSSHQGLKIIAREEVSSMLFAPKEKGQGLVEYALILVLVAVVVIVILALLGPAIGNIFSNIMESI
jgi:pilus assembly protein Flp/PilA